MTNGLSASYPQTSHGRYPRFPYTATAVAAPDRWSRVEIFYSGTEGGDIDQIAARQDLAGAEDINFHFLICNGRGADNGLIQTAERWRRQWSCVPGGRWYGTPYTIRICVVADGRRMRPTDCQMKRTGELVEQISRTFNVRSDNICYPEGWQL